MDRPSPSRLIALALGFALAAPPLAAEPEGARTQIAAAEASTDWEGGERLVWDPLEPMNRGIFQFNETLDAWLLEPVATGWDRVLPNRVQRCIANFFTHLVLPVRFANDLLQLKPVKAFDDTGRFVTNSLIGVVRVGRYDTGVYDTGLPEHPLMSEVARLCHHAEWPGARNE